MATTSTSQFASPSSPGDPLSVIILVEDSRAMAVSWTHIRQYYLPPLLETLRRADVTVPMRVWWLTSSSAFSPFTTAIDNTSACNEIPDLTLGHHLDSQISTGTIRRSINIYMNSNKRQRCNQHFVIVAASALLPSADVPTTTPGDTNPWLGTALALCQEKMRPHMILTAVSSKGTFRQLFEQACYVQSLTEVVPWFRIDTARFEIHLSGSLLHRSYDVTTTRGRSPPHKQGVTGLSPEMASMPMFLSPPPSPTHQGSPSTSRRSSVSATPPSRSEGRGGESSRAPHDALGLVSYLQRMHGLTKKRSYGAKPAKRATGADVRGAGSARPILPRLDLPGSPYAVPGTSADHKNGISDPSTAMRTSPVAERSPPGDRRSRTRNHLPPLSPSSPGSSTAIDSTTAALLSLQSMTPRLTEFHNMDQSQSSRSSKTSHAPANHPIDRGAELMQALAYHNAEARASGWSQDQPFSSGYTTAMLTSDTARAPPAFNRSYSVDETTYQPPAPLTPRQSISYNSTPMASQTTSPLPSPGLTAPDCFSNDVEDQPFIVTPEYEALVNARFEEAVRSGAIQAASVTSSLSHAFAGLQPGATAPLRQDRQQGTYLAQLPNTLAAPRGALTSQDNSFRVPTSQFQGPAMEWNSGQQYNPGPSTYGGSAPGSWYSP
ncbi:hypothetical protein WOLCODRAFT_165876 [Wolfiporia cocos MD-104 SS10]|uniref:Uncharacterized protein n=1 Tax=Wolfiporia cocos (strain MD-104) TaxID=742152 RepID=A0A2H3J503_WOLCO|nr:hypothetical protein WOLCODRAFT_165876 [Wolfiporia cocos MD-104 SS10]